MHACRSTLEDPTKISGASAANPVVIKAASGTATLYDRGTDAGFCGNQTLSGAISTSNEPVLGLIGTDYVTVRGLALVGGSTVDRGLLVTQTSPSDGAQNNAFENLSVTLDRTNPATLAVQQITLTSPSDAGGTNSNNRYDNLTVSNVFAGVSLAGNVNFMDDGCEVGVTAGGVTMIGSASAGDIGNGASQTFGIRATNQSNVRIFGAEVRNLIGTSTSAVDGILLDNSSASSVSSGTCEVFNNKIHDLQSTSTSGGTVCGIRVNLTTHPSSVSRIYDNFVYGLNTASTATTSRRIIGISIQDGGSGSGATHQVDFNSVRLSPSNVTAPNTCFEIATASGPVIKVRDNVFANFVGTQSGSGKHYCWVTPSGNAIGAAGSQSDHNVLYINNTANGFLGLAGLLDRGSLTDWQGVAGTDINSTSANPNFVSSIDLHIKTTSPTPVESRGSFFGGAISWVPRDFDGDTRNASTPDVGADEGNFIVLVLNDVSAASLIEPPPSSTKFVNTTFSPQASFENAGTVDQLNVPVRYRIIGPSPSTAVVYNQTAVIDTLVAAGSRTVTFPSTSIATGGMYTMEAGSELANDQAHANDKLTGSLEVAGPLNGTYTIGASSAAPFNSLTNAIARLNAIGVSGPVSLQLADASYGAGETFPITISSYPGSGAANTVTLRPAPGATVAVTGSSNRAVFVLDGADYFTIDGSNTAGGTTRDLTITNSSNSGASAVVWGQTTLGGDPVTHVTVRDAVLQGSGNTQTLLGIGFGSSTISVTSNGTGNVGNTVDNCKVLRTQYGVYSGGQSAANKNTGTVITNNRLDAAAPDNIQIAGILVRFENGVQIAQNQIGNLSTGGSSSAIGISLGLPNVLTSVFAGDEVVNATVSRNKITGVAQTNGNGLSAAGIAVAQAASGTTTIVNNMITGVVSPATDPDVTVGIMLGGGAGSTTQIYFNSVSMSGSRGPATAPSFALAVGGTDPTLDVRDNILSNLETSSGGVGDSYAIGLNYSTYLHLTSNNNDFRADPGAGQFAIVGGLLNSPNGDRTSLSTWRAETGRDGNSISADPLFVSATDLHITASGSPVANLGAPISGVTVDIDGEPGLRTTTPDIGADEFGTHLLNVTVVGNGSVAKNPDRANYVDGAVVQLTATAAAGYHFVGWTGDLNSASNPVNVTMNTDKNVTATFAVNVFSLNVTIVGNGAVARNPNQASYAQGSVVQLTATPSAGYHFGSWSGDASGSTNPLSVTMDANKNITATFIANTYAVNVATTGTGTVAKNPDLALYDFGSNVVLTATPGQAYSFSGWSGDASGSTNPLTVNVDGDKNITANFTPNLYTLSIQTVGTGSVAKNPDQANYIQGTTVTISATAGTGYHFSGWSGDASGSTNPLDVVLDSNKNITATFAINTYTLTVNSGGNGTVGKNPDQAMYDHGSSVVLTANPAVGYHFASWSGDASGSTNPLTLPMDGNKSVTATFAINTYALNTSTTGSGSVGKSPNQATYDHGTTVQLTASPGVGSNFVNWSGDASGSSNPISVLMDGVKNVTANFATNTYTLGLTVAGNGTVSKSPDQASYPFGNTVTLTATPTPGHAFVGWSGDANGSTNPLVVTMDTNKNITASFTYALNVSVVGEGAVGANPNQANYAPGTVVQLTPSANPGHSFVGWAGDAGGSANPLSVTMNSNKNITAQFTTALNVTVVGNGSVTPNPNQPNYAPGSVVQLTATPATGFHLVGWSGDASGSASPLSVTMTGTKNITATFAINTYTLDAVALGGGTVTRTPSQATYDHGTVVQVDAAPTAGQSFLGWSGAASGTTTPIMITMDGNKSVTGSFTAGLVVNVVGNGSIVKTPDQVNYTPNQNVSIQANPAVGNHFMGWSGDASGSTNPLSVAMSQNRNITATFAPNMYALNTTTVGAGSIVRNPNQANYAHGTVVQLTATPAVGYHFVSWSGDASGSTNPINVTMDGVKNITATFAINTYTLNVTTVGSGAVSKSPDQPTYDHGTKVLLTATPPAGYTFAGWSGDAQGAGNPVSIVMDHNVNVTATFTINTYALDVQVAGGGTVTRNPDQTGYQFGTVVQLTATPANGSHFVGWSGAVNGTSNPLSVTMDDNKSVTATFQINTYSIDLSTIGNGSVTRDPDQSLYDHGTKVILTANPALGYHLVSWGGDASGSASPLSLVMDGSKSITATFAINQYALTVGVVDSGSVTRDPDQPLYDHGTVVLLTPVPAPRHHFVGWSGDATGSISPLQVTMDGDKNINAIFAVDIWPLDVSTNGHGSVDRFPNSASYVTGTTVRLTALADPGYHFTSWGGDLSGSANPKLITVDAPKSVSATFDINNYTLQTQGTGGGSVARNPNLASYTSGSTVQLTAVPDAAHHFRDWIGDASGTDNPLTITMNGNKNITARFWDNLFTFNVTTSGGQGTIQKIPDQPNYNPGTKIDLTCTPQAGYQFVRWTWNGRDTVVANPMSVTVDSNLTINATLVPGSAPTLTVNTTGPGHVTKDPDQATYVPGTWVAVTPVPDPGYRFVSWSGVKQTKANPLYVFVDRDYVLGATFEPNFASLNVTVTGGGSVVKNPNQTGYDFGSTVQLTALPAAGFHFLGWSGDATGSLNPLTVLMDQSKSITAAFGYTLSLTTVGAGGITASPLKPVYAPGATVQLTAKPGAGYHFVSWSGDAGGSANPVTVTMSADRHVTANFAADTYQLDVQVVGSGSVTKNPNRLSYDLNSVVNLTETANAGWHFVGWENCPVDRPMPAGEGGGAVADCDYRSEVAIWVTMTSNRRVVATFEPNGGLLALEVVGSGAVIEDESAKPAQPKDTVVLVAKPEEGWTFSGWAGDVSGSENPKTIALGSGKQVRAVFLDTNAPRVSLRASSLAEGLEIGQTARLEWMAAAPEGVSSVDLLLSRNGADGPFETLAKGLTGSSYAWTVTGPAVDPAYLRVVAHDPSGRTSASTVRTTIGSPAAAAALVTDFGLDPPSPNPARDAVQIGFAVPRRAPVRLTVLDVQGREVATLADEVYAPGRYRVSWSGLAGRNRAPAGVYFIRMRSEGVERVRRLMLSR